MVDNDLGGRFICGNQNYPEFLCNTLLIHRVHRLSSVPRRKKIRGEKWNCQYRTGNSHWTVKLYYSSQNLIARSQSFFAKFKGSSLSVLLANLEKKPSDFSNFSIRIYLESRISRCISERPLACYVMALSRQTARTFPGHRTSINYRSFHERLKITRVYQIQATSSGKMEIANHGKRIGSADRSAEISLRKWSIESIFPFFSFSLSRIHFFSLDFNLF